MTNLFMIGRKAFLETRLALSLLCCLVAGSHAWGHGAGGDIAIFSTDNQVDIGFAILDDVDEVQEFFDPNQNVFSLLLLPQFPNDVIPWQFGTSEPGFDADEDALPPEADIVYNLLELRYWDGQSAEVQLAPATGINAGVAPSPEKTFPSGGFHSHPLFGVADTSGTAANGVYVGKLTVSVEGLADSDPYYMIALLTDDVTSLGTPLEQAAVAELIGDMARLHADDPLSNPAPIYEGTDYTFFSNAIRQVRAEAVPEPTGLALAASVIVGRVALGRRRR